MGKKIPIIFSRSIEYLTGMNSDRKLRNVDGRSHITIKETELLPTQSLPIYDIEQKVIDSLNNPAKNIDLISWNLHFHHEADATSIKDRIQQNIDQNNTVVIALQETIEQYTTQNIFADQGDKWFYLQTPTYQQYWKNAQAIDNEQKTDTELFNLSRVLASNKPFTDIKYLVMPYTVESYKNYKSAIAGKLDDIWFVVVHLASSSAANGRQLENLKDLIIKKLGNPDKLVIMGDLNQATDDKDVKQFVKELNLSDALPIGATWCNAKNAESNQQHIDHILIKGVAFDKGKIVDTCKQSDHKMVKCTIKL
jgi:endonuclease/exonuclease/phosphatase family metal-dependent hydrolase